MRTSWSRTTKGAGKRRSNSLARGFGSGHEGRRGSQCRAPGTMGQLRCCLCCCRRVRVRWVPANGSKTKGFSLLPGTSGSPKSPLDKVT